MVRELPATERGVAQDSILKLLFSSAGCAMGIHCQTSSIRGSKPRHSISKPCIVESSCLMLVDDNGMDNVAQMLFHARVTVATTHDGNTTRCRHQPLKLGLLEVARITLRDLAVSHQRRRQRGVVVKPVPWAGHPK